MGTSIPVDHDVRDRLRRYGSAGDTYNDILTKLMDDADRKAFVAEMRRRAEALADDEWVDLEDA